MQLIHLARLVGFISLIGRSSCFCPGLDRASSGIGISFSVGRTHHRAPPSTKGQTPFAIPSSPTILYSRFQGTYNFDFFDEDFYFALNVTRDATRDEIKDNFRRMAKEYHPDKFFSEMQFSPENLTVPQLKAYLEQEKSGGIHLLLEKSELVERAWEVYGRTKHVNQELTEKRLEINSKFALLNEAYSTLYDDKTREMYNLSGEWGIPGIKFKRKTGPMDMGDREEAERRRKRAQAAQRDELQEKVYRRYMKEKAEQEAKEKEFQERMAKKRAEEKEKRRLERQRMGLPELEDMTDEERRRYNQEQIKKQWAGLFEGINTFFGKNKRTPAGKS